MKIAVLSDTHGNFTLAIRMLDRIAGLDCIIHLGDLLHDAEIIEQVLDIPVIKLAGNCDSAPQSNREILLTLDDKSLFLSHGDHYQVKNGSEKIYEKAFNMSADIVLYGHTHKALVEKKGDIILLNPGTLKDAASQQSLAILKLERSEVTAEIVDAKNIDFSAP
ncbi:MAG: YfcE family phosphodiesterase [Geobacteraceae bacterium]